MRSAAQIRDSLVDYLAVGDAVADVQLGDELKALREAADVLEAVNARLLYRFDKSREYASEGHPSAASWMRANCRMTGASAAQRVSVARSLAELPETESALANAEIGYQHVAHIARTAEAVGVETVRDAEEILLTAARQLGPGQFRIVTWHLRHAVDPDGALAEANKLHERRYLHISEMNGMFHLDGLFDAEGGALLRTTINALSKPTSADDRSPKQRRADALLEIARQTLDRCDLPRIGGQRPHLTITTTVETLAGLAGNSGADLEWGLPLPGETLRRLACDASIRLVVRDADGRVLDMTEARRTISPSLRRAAAMRDKHCRFPGCDRPADWTVGHHVRHACRGGRTSLPNTMLLCGFHHRLVHEGGWEIVWGPDGEAAAIPPERFRRRPVQVARRAADPAAG
jgi:Domain of unknown function (DUF222)